MGPLRKEGRHLAKQTCCHQQIVSWQEQWGWVSVLSVSHSCMQSSRNVFLLQTEEKEVETATDKTALLAGPTFAGVVYHSPLSHMVFVFSLPHCVLGFVSLLKI